jgi:phosphoenolpyruvate synthase/pyruvate phosphate dikinase
LTTAAFDLALESKRGEGAAGNSDFELPVREAALEARRDMLPAIVGQADSPLAVRSSATLGDGQERSYAGVFRTTLGVRGEAASLRAIQNCWRSFPAGPSEM